MTNRGRHRLFLAAAAVLLSIAPTSCKQRADDPYWSNIDRISREFYVAKASDNSSREARTKTIEKLQRLRHDAALPHPEYANKYHSLKIAEMEAWIDLSLEAQDPEFENSEDDPPGLREVHERWNELRRLRIEKLDEKVRKLRAAAADERNRILRLPSPTTIPEASKHEK